MASPRVLELPSHEIPGPVSGPAPLDHEREDQILPKTPRPARREDRRLPHYPTDPSSEIEISFCASTANSIGNCCGTSLTKPLTTSATASSCESPRCMQ